ncbi:MAG: class I SAM-dependent methyltransferase [Verrucomicrobiota bacterium]
MKKINKAAKGVLKNIAMAVPFVNSRVNRYIYLSKIVRDAGFEPGHYYSPVPDLGEITRDADSAFSDKELPGIDLNTDNQVKLLQDLKSYYPEYVYNLPDMGGRITRYQKNGAFYRHSDCVFLYGMMRKYQPRRIIEVGSGHSSALMLDTNEFFFDNKIQHTFIEPHTERLETILKESDRLHNRIIRDKVQNVKIEEFEILERDDILFIDSTHVSKIASDVNYIMFEILPALKPGVLIHFHDVFHGFEYPRHWILDNRWFWNENYLLHAFLMHNKNYEIVALNSYLQRIRAEWFANEMPECLIGSADTGSIWMRKLV